MVDQLSQLRIVVTLPIRETIRLADDGKPMADLVRRILNDQEGLRGMCSESIRAEAVGTDVPKRRRTRIGGRRSR